MKEISENVKAIYVVRQMVADGHVSKDVAEKYFPELKESEDERIRQRIIHALHGDVLEMSEIKEAIAWLERQGEKPQGKSALEAAKEEKVDNANKVEPKDYNDIDPHFGKPADKIEPKFKVGDWVIDKQDIVHQIANVVENVTTHIYGYDIVGGGYFNDSAEGVRLWKIQDAKDGDVLYSLDSCRPFIYKERLQFEQATAYCGINEYGKFFVRNTKDCIIVLDKYVPATKEQRDLLFAKMKEAGYEWDGEKKEPKKIEQKSLSEEDEDIINHLLAICSGVKRYRQFAGCSQDDITKYQTWLKSLKPQTTWKPSDEQIGALEHFVRSIAESGFASPYDSNTKLVYSLLNDLKKLK